jgi:hypothetical protein
VSNRLDVAIGQSLAWKLCRVAKECKLLIERTSKITKGSESRVESFTGKGKGEKEKSYSSMCGAPF